MIKDDHETGNTIDPISRLKAEIRLLREGHLKDQEFIRTLRDAIKGTLPFVENACEDALAEGLKRAAGDYKAQAEHIRSLLQ